MSSFLPSLSSLTGLQDYTSKSTLLELTVIGISALEAAPQEEEASEGPKKKAEFGVVLEDFESGVVVQTDAVVATMDDYGDDERDSNSSRDEKTLFSDVQFDEEIKIPIRRNGKSQQQVPTLQIRLYQLSVRERVEGDNLQQDQLLATALLPLDDKHVSGREFALTLDHKLAPKSQPVFRYCRPVPPCAALAQHIRSQPLM